MCEEHVCIAEVLKLHNKLVSFPTGMEWIWDDEHLYVHFLHFMSCFSIIATYYRGLQKLWETDQLNLPPDEIVTFNLYNCATDAVNLTKMLRLIALCDKQLTADQS